MQRQVVVIGAGMGGLSAACMLGRAGAQVVLLEAAPQVGGKAFATEVQGRPINLGPSVLTLRRAFDAIFEACGERLADAVTLQALPQLARHVWQAGCPGAPERAADAAPAVLDLYADAAASAEGIGALFGARAARDYLAFAAYAERLYAIAAETFIFGAKPSMWQAARIFGPRILTAAWEMDARRTMDRALVAAFPQTPALRQLFGRYATYCGGSPYHAPATLNLISHVERLGVWAVDGGIAALAAALAALAARQGVQVRCNARVVAFRRQRGRVTGVQLADGEVIEGEAFVFGGDLRALEAQDLGGSPTQAQDEAGSRPLAKGLSADVAGFVAQVDTRQGFTPALHNVIFAGAPQDEFTELFERRRRPTTPTVYVCAPDRAPQTQAPADVARDVEAAASPTQPAPERFFCLVNAPPTRQRRGPEELTSWNEQLVAHLGRGGLLLQPRAAPVNLQAADFGRRFFGSDGALYGQPPHSWRSFFTRPGSSSGYGNVFLAGGGVHPGPGVPMAALSGQRAAEALLCAFPSIVRSELAATPGGTSTAKATTASTKYVPSSL